LITFVLRFNAVQVHQPVNVSAVDEELERMKQQGLVA
jgi:hypothetical protein